MSTLFLKNFLFFYFSFLCLNSSHILRIHHIGLVYVKKEKQFASLLCRRPESNRYGRLVPQDFKSCASASSATPA